MGVLEASCLTERLHRAGDHTAGLKPATTRTQSRVPSQQPRLLDLCPPAGHLPGLPCTRCWGHTQPEVASWFLHTPAKELGVSEPHSAITVNCPGIAPWWQK